MRDGRNWSALPSNPGPRRGVMRVVNGFKPSPMCPCVFTFCGTLKGMRLAHETPLEMTRRHVRESEAHVQRQRALVIRLQSLGDTLHAEAESLLAALEDTLQQHNAHLARLEAKRG